MLRIAAAEAARLLPATVPPESREPVALAMLTLALPLVPELRRAEVLDELLDLHRPLGPDGAGRDRLCLHCQWVWPCPTARLCLPQTSACDEDSTSIPGDLTASAETLPAPPPRRDRRAES